MQKREKEYIEIVFLGDSFTNRTGVKNSNNPEKIFSTLYTGSYVETVEKRLFVHHCNEKFIFYNKGISGETVSDVLDRFEDDFNGLNPDIVVLLIGHNDIKMNSFEKFLGDYQTLINKLGKCSNLIIGISILPMNKYPELNGKVEIFNNSIKEVIYRNGYEYLDIYNQFVYIMYECKKRINLFEETSHLSELGNVYIADCVYESIEKLVN